MPSLPYALQRIIIALVILLILAYLGMKVMRPKAEKMVEEKGLDAPAQALGKADFKLTEMIKSRLFSKNEEEDEYIDLDHPKDKDILFLMNTFRGKDPNARLSAARALILIQTPRAVGLLLRAEGTEEELTFYCEGALEILRFRTREEAVALMVDVLEDEDRPVSELCRPQLEEKLAFLRAEDPVLLRTLLNHDSARVRIYALKHLPVVLDEDLIDLIGRLSESAIKEEQEQARRWLSRISVVNASPSPLPPSETHP